MPPRLDINSPIELDFTGRLAIMQPYLFPYIGYYQMAAAVDNFIFYDDVNFIKGGYIQRNKLLVNGSEWLFTVPLSKASPNMLIMDVEVDSNRWEHWKSKFLRTVEQSYRKARNYSAGWDLLNEVLNTKTNCISELSGRSISCIMERLGREVNFEFSSDSGLGDHLRFEDRIMYMCKERGVQEYVQSSGGRDLYSPEKWAADGLSIKFLIPKSLTYDRPGGPKPGLSILDAILHLPFEELNVLLDEYDLVTE